jgi:hypothetical protein
VSSSPIVDVEVRKNGRRTAKRARTETRPVALRVLPPRRRRRRRRWRSTIAAILATGAYAGAVVAAYQLVVPVLRDGSEPKPALAEPAAEEATPQPAPSAGGRDLLAVRALAARAQRSVFLVEGAGGVQGSGFVAWQSGGKSYLITSRTLVAGVLRDGGSIVFVRRGRSFWEADIAREDARSGLALLRVHDGIGRPLWRGVRGATDSLATGERAVVVPAGPDTPLEQAAVGAWRNRAFLVEATPNPLNVGAAVVGRRGRIAGVVVAVTPGGGNRVVPVGRACGSIRSCG